MNRKLLTLLLLLCSASLIRAQQIDTLWTFDDDTSYIVFQHALDDQGNTYIWAQTKNPFPGGTTDLQFGPGETLVSGYITFLAKYDPKFRLLWWKQINPNFKGLNGMFSFLINGEKMLMSGILHDTLDFDLDPVVTVNRMSPKKFSYYLWELDTSGNFRKVQMFEGGKNAFYGSPIPLKVEPAANKGIYLSGSVDDSLDLNPGPGRAMVGHAPLSISEKRFANFVVLLDSNWNYVKHASVNSERDLFPCSFVGGKFVFLGSQKATLVPQTGHSIPLNDTGELVRIEYDQALNYLGYSKPFGGNGDRYFQYLKGSDGTEYLQGSFGGTLILNVNGSADTLHSHGQWDFLIVRLQNFSSMVVSHLYHVGTVGSESPIWVGELGQNDLLFRVQMASADIPAPSPDFDPGPGVSLVDKRAKYGAGLLRLDKELNFRWAGSWVGEDMGSNIVSVLNDSTLFITSYLSSDVDGDYDLSWEKRDYYATFPHWRQFFVKYRFPKPVQYQQQASTCTNQGYVFDHKLLTTTGSYTGTFQHGSNGDSVVTLHLTANPVYAFLETDTFCPKHMEQWHGQTISVNGIYYDSLKTTRGCDSVFRKQVFYRQINASASDAGSGFLQVTPGFASYQWVNCYDGFSKIDGATQDLFLPAHGGLYGVIVTDAFSCRDTTNCVQIQGVGIPGQGTKDLSIYPNPFEDALRYSGAETGTTLEMYDARGAQVLSHRTENTSGYIPAGHFAAGVYVLVMRTQEGVVRKQVVKK